MSVNPYSGGCVKRIYKFKAKFIKNISADLSENIIKKNSQAQISLEQ